ncbi:MAG: LacI family DNA-binding transcriptional regulator [Thermodesulfobacteriota bacterium]
MNIKDIAKQAGVSVATVSHVINKTRYVSEELTRRVNKVIAENDFHANAMAGSLRRKKTKTVGLIVPDNSNPLYAELAKAIENLLFAQDIALILCNSEHVLEREESYLDALRAKMVDGLIVIPASDQSGHINRAVASGLPVVILDRPLPKVKTDEVLIDHYQGVSESARYLISLGRKRIAYLDKKFDLPHKLVRLQAFKQALADQGLKFDQKLHAPCGVSLEDGARAMAMLLDKSRRPDAVICFDDIIAMGALRVIQDRGLSVPGDVALIGFDDMPLCSYTVPRLTTVYYPRHQMAEIACRVLLSRIEEANPEPPVRVVLPLRLVIRESTPRPPAAGAGPEPRA